MTEPVACLVSGCELAQFSMCTGLVTVTVACLVSDSELVWLLMCTVLVTVTVASCVVTVGELACIFTVLFSGNAYFDPPLFSMYAAFLLS